MASKLEGMERLKRRIARIPENIREPIKEAVQKNAEQVAGEIRRMAPEDSGRLKQSVRTEPGRSPMAVLIKAGGPLTTVPIREGSGKLWDYALGVEYGVKRHTQQGVFKLDPSINLLTRAGRREAKGKQKFHPGTMGTRFFYGTWLVEKRRLRQRLTAAMKRAIAKSIDMDKAA